MTARFAGWVVAGLVLATGVLSLHLAAQAQTPVRDRVAGATPAPTGTASLSGVILTDDPTSRPLRHAVVTLNATEIRVGRTTVTDDAGRFEFTDLPAGRFSLVATKGGYLTTYYRGKRPGRPPAVPIPLADDQHLADITVRMVRGGVLTGRVLDANGHPVFVSIQASLVQTVNGERTVSPIGGGYSYADERGVYRLYGLAPGDYVLSATPPRLGGASADVRVTTPADVQRAEIAVREARAGAARPPSAAPPPPPTEPQMIGYSTVYYPGTTDFTSAGVITLGPAEERADVDFRLMMTPLSKVEGLVMLPDGQPAEGATVSLVSLGALGANSAGMMTRPQTGAFSFPSVAPGAYTLMARTGRIAGPVGRGSGAPPPAASGAAAPPTWALMDITIDGRSMRDITLTLQPGVSLSGRVVVDAGTRTPPSLTAVQVTLDAVQPGSGATFGVAPAQADDTGAFTFTGITPGKYKMNATVTATRPGVAWTMKSAIIDGRDASDLPVDIRGNTTDAVATLTDRRTELSGLLQDASGVPSPEYSLVVFSADKRYWTRNSRRLRGPIRPGADGRFIVSDLPPGDYFLAAVTDVDASELNDTSLLEQLAAAAVKITLVEGEKKVQDIKIGGGVRIDVGTPLDLGLRALSQSPCAAVDGVAFAVCRATRCAGRP